MSELALLGGKPVRTKPFSKYNTIGVEEEKAVIEVLRSGNLSQFYGSWHPDFYGGPKVQEFERKWSEFFGTKYAVGSNSATSSLYCAIGACDIGPGDEVIVPPYTMTASCTSVIIYGAIPVFVDILPDTFCLDPLAIEKAITPNTKAIMVVHIFGHPAKMDEIMNIAKKHNLKVIEDCAQAPTSTINGKYVGTFGDIGIFSLNYHKHIYTGEGGMAITNSQKLAEKLQLIRNHGEAVVGKRDYQDIVNTVGWNYRLCEIEAAIGIEQLKKINAMVDLKISVADQISDGIKGLKGIYPPTIYKGYKHVYYLYPMIYKEEETGISRDLFTKAVEAEGIPLWQGYEKPLYLQPMYQKKLAFGSQGCPFSCKFNENLNINYQKGICPVVENLYEKELLTFEICSQEVSSEDAADIVEAINKVYENIDILKRTKL